MGPREGAKSLGQKSAGVQRTLQLPSYAGFDYERSKIFLGDARNWDERPVGGNHWRLLSVLLKVVPS